MGGHAIIQALKNKHQETFKNIQLLLFIKAHDKVFWVDDPESGNPLVRCLEDVEAEVAPDERPLEAAGSIMGMAKTSQPSKGIRATDPLDSDLFTYDASLFKDEEGAVSADEYDEREEDEEAEPDSGARGSEDVKEMVEAGAINEKLFLEEEDLPDDLDDLDEADEEAVEDSQAARRVFIALWQQEARWRLQYADVAVTDKE
ncbi:hypothetical protein AK812_SmicGene32926 [Symbiodinium microadriaticum]|uniref:Uncharacterized protein n=1 Tax=Symbiodinium microadriaticum TaxID=2951 RepID=A0A1Q9CT05_SYMMI|nr:hypothetical protein AK812_SmicGene32926 [Symbiodinium microadriaticum]